MFSHASGRFVRCGVVYVTVGHGAAHSCISAHLCGRAFVGRAFLYCHAPTMPPRIRIFRAPVIPRIHGAAHLYAAAHQCCRALVVLPRTCIPPLIPGAARLCATAHLRMWPRSPMYCRALTWCHAWLMLPRTRHVATRCRDRRYVWLCFRASHITPRSTTCGRALHCVTSGRTLFC